MTKSKFLSVLCGGQEEIYWLKIQFKKLVEKGLLYVEKTSSSWGTSYLKYRFTSKYLLVKLHQKDNAGKYSCC